MAMGTPDKTHERIYELPILFSVNACDMLGKRYIANVSTERHRKISL